MANLQVIGTPEGVTLPEHTHIVKVTGGCGGSDEECGVENGWCDDCHPPLPSGFKFLEIGISHDRKAEVSSRVHNAGVCVECTPLSVAQSHSSIPPGIIFISRPSFVDFPKGMQLATAAEYPSDVWDR